MHRGDWFPLAARRTASYSSDAPWASAAGPLRRLVALVVLLLLPAAPTLGQIITTVAGGGPVEGLGPDVTLDSPAAVATDAAGNVFIGVPYRVFRWDRATGTTTVVAGTGRCCDDGDGGPATAAILGLVQGLAVSAAGDVYVLTGNRVRKIGAATGLITTVAGSGSWTYGGDGGPATGAGLDARGLAIDAAGNLYIADTNHYRIRRVNASTQIITTVAGNGTERVLR